MIGRNTTPRLPDARRGFYKGLGNNPGIGRGVTA
jgi:hypothetical protein